jgi:NAD-dependent deacetylase
MATLPPACPQCRGIVKGDTVMFGEPIPRQALEECYVQAERADCVLIAGTSATVYPAASFPEMVLQRGGTGVEVNTDPTPFSPYCAAVLRGPSGVLLPQLVERVKALVA